MIGEMSIRRRIGEELLRIGYLIVGDKLGQYRLLAENLPEIDGTVLDLGGGPGYIHDILESKGAKYIINLDVDYLFLKRNKVNVDKILAPAEIGLLRGSSIDYITIHDALHHFNDPSSVLRIYRDIVKSSLFIIDIDRTVVPGALAETIEKLLGFPARFMSIGDVVNLLIVNGFRIDKVRMGLLQYFIQASRRLKYPRSFSEPASGGSWGST